ncbi:hypothetical protein BLOT_012363, partial [Blomia tropicalis]
FKCYCMLCERKKYEGNDYRNWLKQLNKRKWHPISVSCLRLISTTRFFHLIKVPLWLCRYRNEAKKEEEKELASNSDIFIAWCP